MDNRTKVFKTVEEERDFWKEQAHQLQAKNDEMREEFEEYQEHSQQLETELEQQLNQSEMKNKELSGVNFKLQLQCDNLTEKLEKTGREKERQIVDLQNSLSSVTSMRDDLQKYIRELEQTNDDLERAKRAAVISLEDFELKLNQAIERNAFLENELDEKESMKVTVQRLKDEARDLKQEIAVHTVHSDDHMDSNKKAEEQESMNNNSNQIVTPTSTPLKTSFQSVDLQNTPLTPSARISALNIVGDLLRKVGALESKLASCKQFVDQQQTPHNPYRPSKISPGHSPRAKRFNRGGSLPAKVL